MFKNLLAMIVVCVMSLGIVPAQAKEQTVTIVIGFSPGGGSDRIAKQIQQVLEASGKKVIIDYRPGAGGSIAARHVATDNSSDVKFLMQSSTALVPKNLESHDIYRWQDLRPTVYLGYVPMLLVGHKNYGIQTLDELLVTDKPSPRVGSAGVGSGTHISAELFFSGVNKPMIHVPYKGAAPMLTDLVAGRIEMAFIFPAQVKPYTTTGDLVPLAVAGSKRLEDFSGVPTLDEKNLPDAYAKLMFMLFANPGADVKTVNEIKKIIQQAWQATSTADSFRKNADMEIDPIRVLDIGVLLEREFKKYGQLAANRPEILVK